MITPEYAAGFFDGEGCVCLARNKQADSVPSYVLWVTVTNNQREPLDALEDQFGGKIHAKGKDRLGWVWQLTGLKARPFLEVVLPHLLCKKPQAEIALEYLKLYGMRGISDQREKFKSRIEQENRKHRSPRSYW